MVIRITIKMIDNKTGSTISAIVKNFWRFCNNQFFHSNKRNLRQLDEEEEEEEDGSDVGWRGGGGGVMVFGRT